ncbi:hypothetical protein DEU56DRAFT_296983 [Suillus clintonianus]|uniref:uncharacterized protein n=1 Tax=Suillus clintonianus TaxID=1904413 RepID=UPI001B8837F5|nr:uncharacterized protein DEU56DRAFT_296983 [Suillus clintonianus]KAG2140178.1 hypothetical protein DEU56DRAFT_296983 [Suillus clintonianus]
MASPGIPLDTATIMSSVLEGILYGFSVLMFIGTIWMITYGRRIQNINWPATVVATLMFLLSTAHMVVGTIRLEDGLVKYRDTFPGGPVAFFGDTSDKIFVVKYVIIVLQTLLGDGVVIYRCYLIWQSVWIVIVPCIMWCGVAAFGVFTACNFSRASIDINIFTHKTGHLVATFITLTLATNLLSSGLLAYRIWFLERKVSAIRTTKGRMPLLRVLVDAAILYSATLCSSLICFALSNNGLYIMAYLNVPIISIAFYMVFIRIASNQHIQDSIVFGAPSEVERGNSQQYPMQPLHGIYIQNDVSFLGDSPKVPIHTLV